MINKKVKIIFLLISILIGMSFCVKVNAAVQSTPATHTKPATKSWDGWMSYIRSAESSGGGMGLSEIVTGESLMPDGADNGIDVHMTKNTEYGAMAILALSGYGNLDKSKAIPEKVTGNATGVYMKDDGKWELVAGLRSDVTNNKSFKSRYYNVYGPYSGTDSLKGDATEELASFTTWQITKNKVGTGTVYMRGSTSNYGSDNQLVQWDYVERGGDGFLSYDALDDRSYRRYANYYHDWYLKNHSRRNGTSISYSSGSEYYTWDFRKLLCKRLCSSFVE